MKKYILLATTAVLMTTANAFAADTVHGDIIEHFDVNAELVRFASFSAQEGLSFGSLAFDAEAVSESDWFELATVSAGDGSLSTNTAVVKANYLGSGQATRNYLRSIEQKEFSRVLSILATVTEKIVSKNICRIFRRVFLISIHYGPFLAQNYAPNSQIKTASLKRTLF